MIHFTDIIQCSALEAQALCDRWKEEGISGVVNVAWNIEPPVRYDVMLPVLKYPARDEVTPERAWFTPVLAFYDWARSLGKVVVHCQAGANRSRGLAAILMIARHDVTVDRAWEILGGRPGHEAWIKAAENFRL